MRPCKYFKLIEKIYTGLSYFTPSSLDAGLEKGINLVSVAKE